MPTQWQRLPASAGHFRPTSHASPDSALFTCSEACSCLLMARLCSAGGVIPLPSLAAQGAGSDRAMLEASLPVSSSQVCERERCEQKLVTSSSTRQIHSQAGAVEERRQKSLQGACANHVFAIGAGELHARDLGLPVVDPGRRQP